MPDTRTPFANLDERATLLAFLDYLRNCVIAKASASDEQSIRWTPVPSGTSLLGLLKHLTMVEVAWFQYGFVGSEVPIPSTDVTPSDSLETAIAAYRGAIDTANQVVKDCDSLDRLCQRKGTAPEPMSLRWLLVHMIEETARHAGHADIIREQIDGSTGR
jgi:uncharacterized damage-inducible protein DinB